MNYLKHLCRPEIFQGQHKKRDYFEGWYFKHVSENGQLSLSIIPGINYENKKKSAFIQVIMGPPIRSYFIPYDIQDFSWTDDPFSISIGKNSFSLKGIELDINYLDLILKGKISYSKGPQLHKTLLAPNVMGFFAYFNFMECYHGVISLNHKLFGTINHNGDQIKFNGGKGYIEKDWGTSFPKRYIWVQCNHFKDSDVSVMCSIAHIPFLSFEFLGFIVVLNCRGKQYRFATYNCSKILRISKRGDLINLIFKHKKTSLLIQVEKSEGSNLKAPHKGIMKNNIKEVLSGTLRFSLYENNHLLYKAMSHHAGIEVVNWKGI